MLQNLKNQVFDLAPEAVKRYLFRRRQARRLTDVEFQALQRQFGQDTRARARYCHDRYDVTKHGLWGKLPLARS